MSEPYSLDHFSKELLEPMVKRFAEANAAEIIFRSNALEDALFMGLKPPTKWQRFKYKLEDIKKRFKDIWTIVSGGDIHKNCGY